MSAIRTFCKEHEKQGFSDAVASSLERKAVLDPNSFTRFTREILMTDVGLEIGHVAFIEEWLEKRNLHLKSATPPLPTFCFVPPCPAPSV